MVKSNACCEDYPNPKPLLWFIVSTDQLVSNLTSQDESEIQLTHQTVPGASYEHLTNHANTIKSRN